MSYWYAENSDWGYVFIENNLPFIGEQRWTDPDKFFEAPPGDISHAVRILDETEVLVVADLFYDLGYDFLANDLKKDYPLPALLEKN